MNRTWRDGWWRAARAVPSPNVDERPQGEDVSLVIVHSISLPPGQYGGDAVEALFMNRLDPTAHPSFEALRGLRVSAHFFIRRNGEVIQFASCLKRAWHAGVSSWRGRSACNDYSIGVELEGLEGLAFEDVQYHSLARLLRSLRRQFPLRGVAGHEHVAPTRKRDPGARFEWERLRREARLPRVFLEAITHKR